MSYYDELENIDDSFGFEDRPEWNKLYGLWEDSAAKDLALSEISKTGDQFKESLQQKINKNKLDSQMVGIELSLQESYDDMNLNALNNTGFAQSGTDKKMEDEVLKSISLNAEAQINDIKNTILTAKLDTLKTRTSIVDEEWDIYNMFLQADPTFKPPITYETEYTEDEMVQSCLEEGGSAEECQEVTQVYDDWTSDEFEPLGDEFGFDEEEIVDVVTEVEDFLDTEGDGSLWGYGSHCCPYGQYNFWWPCCHFG